MRKRAALSSAVALLVSLLSHGANADPNASAVRVDALADSERRGGVVAVQGSAGDPWMSAEAYVWSGGWEASPISANALTFAFTLHDPKGATDVRFGRFLYTTGAIRPVQIDGASVLVRAPWGSKVETFAGAPVDAGYGGGQLEWMTGGRLSQTFASKITTGLSYVQRRQEGDLADEEVGLDLASAPVKWLDLAARSSYDLTSYGISEAVGSAAFRSDGVRLEVFASDRSPSRLLPDTSLFSVFGDFPAASAGSNLFWRAAPRLDLWLGGAAQTVGAVYGGNGSARALLRLDDRGDSSIGVEVRRQDVSTARWTGLRATGTKPLSRTLRASTELEVVLADNPNGKGAAWPWGLASLGWHPSDLWELAGAFQAASTPEHVAEANALVRFSLFLARR